MVYIHIGRWILLASGFLAASVERSEHPSGSRAELEEGKRYRRAWPPPLRDWAVRSWAAEPLGELCENLDF